MCRPYGNAAKTALQAATKAGWCTQDSFTEFLNAVLLGRGAEPITRATVANWSVGRENMPADVVPLLAEHCAPHEREVLDVFLSSTRHRASPVAIEAAQPETAAARARRVLMALLQADADAADPEGPGGVVYTPEELAMLKPLAERAGPAIERLLASIPDGQLRAFGRAS